MAADNLQAILDEPEFPELLGSLEAGTTTRLRVVDDAGRLLRGGGSTMPWGRGEVVRIPLVEGLEVCGWVEAWSPVKGPAEVERDGGILAGILRQRLEEERRNGEICEEIIRGYSQLNLFYDLSRALGETGDVQGVCRVVLERVTELASAGSGQILLLDEETGRLAVVNSLGAPPLTHDDAALLDGPVTRCDGFSVPIRVQSGAIGAVLLSDCAPDRKLTSQDVKAVALVASFAGATLRHVQLLAQEKELFLGSIRALVSTVEVKDPYTRGHSERVAELALAIGAQQGIGRRKLEGLHLAALLHDIGKIGVPEGILLKEGQLTEEEFAIIRQHPVLGEQILGQIGRLAEIGRIVRHHHERWSGRGYPDGLAGEGIPRESRIIAVADAIDAMMSDRVYRHGLNTEMMLHRLRAGSGSQFEPALVEAFITEILPSAAFRAFEQKLAAA